MTGLSALRQGPVPMPLPVRALGEAPLVASRGAPYEDGVAGHLRHDITGRAAAGPAPVGTVPVGGAVTGIPGVETAGSFLSGLLARTADSFPGRVPAGTVDPFSGRVPAGIMDSMPGRVLAESAGSSPGRVLAGTAATARPSAPRTVPAGTPPAMAGAPGGPGRTVPGLTVPGPDAAPGTARAPSLPGRGPSAIPPAHPEEGA